MTPEALLPCPFCGNTAEFQESGIGTHPVRVHCGSCGVHRAAFGSYKAAALDWNRRAIVTEDSSVIKNRTNMS